MYSGLKKTLRKCLKSTWKEVVHKTQLTDGQWKVVWVD